MADLEILHLSDLHWDTTKANDSKIVVEALLRDLATTKGSKLISPDILVFSGDLVNAGGDENEFNEAFLALIQPALDILQLGLEQVAIVPGNHDIDRDIVRDARFIDNGLLNTLSSVDTVNRFVDDLNAGKPSAKVALDRLSNYYNFVDKLMPDPVCSNQLLRVWKPKVRGLIIGLSCFDTAWRCTGEPNDVDRGHLILGERNVDQAVASTADVDINLAIMHHPLDWLSDFDEVAVSSRLSSNFDLLFCGHTHRPVPQTRTTAQGTAVLSQTGSVYAGRRWFNGYQTAQINVIDATCTFVVRSYYDTPRREFDAATNVMKDGEVTFPFSAQKKSSHDSLVEKFLRTQRQRIRELASDHLDMIGSDALPADDVKESFVAPPLKIKGTANDETSDDADDPKASYNEEISSEEILRSTGSYILSGGREVGKTSLLHYFAVLIAEGVVDKPRIPVVINVEALKEGEYQLRRIISAYFGTLPSFIDLKKSLAAGIFIILADNYVPGGKGATALGEQMKAYPQLRWIVVGQPNPASITGEMEVPTDKVSLKRVRVGALPRRSIRQLSQRWSAAIGSTDDAVFDAVMKQLKADGLPRTGYMVTLILWAMKQEKELDRVNEAILLSNVADYLLEKADFTQAIHGKLDPRGKEITLEYFAEYLRDNDGYANVDDGVRFLSNLFKNKRLAFVAVDVLSELVKCGILDRRDDLIRFKYQPFQDYFVALRLKGDSLLFQSILTPANYAQYAREIEMLAGLRRQNADILSALVDDATRRSPERLNAVGDNEISALIGSSVGLDISKKQLADLRKKRLTANQVDDLLDAADRRATGREANNDDSNSGSMASEKQDAGQLVLTADEPDRMNLSEYVQAINLIATVVRNSDFTDFDDKAVAARLVVNAYSKIAALFRTEVSNLINESQGQGPGKQNALTPPEIGVMIYIVSKVFTTIISDVLVFLLSAPNVGPMMEEICDERETLMVERVFIVILLQSLRSPGWEDRWSAMLRESGQSGFVFETLMGRVRRVVDTQYHDDREYAKIHKVLDAAEEVLGWTKGQKDEVFSNLRKAALQVGLRDSV